MRSVFAVVLLVGLGLAGFAVYMAQNYIEGYQAALEQERQARKPEIETVEVFVVSRTIEYGEPLTAEDVRKVKFPTGALPEGTFSTKDEIFPAGDEVVRTVLRTMEENEALLAVKVSAPGEGAGLISRLERGMRAFAIKVDVASGVSGFLRPGDRVDVYWTGKVRGSGKNRANEEVTKLIEAGITLIAIDQTTNQDLDHGTIARTVTVSVRPEQVAALAQAQSTGRLSLSLVGSLDDTVAAAIEIDQRRLLGIEEQQEVVEEVVEEKVCTIRTRRGAEVVQIPIPCTN